MVHQFRDQIADTFRYLSRTASLSWTSENLYRHLRATLLQNREQPDSSLESLSLFRHAAEAGFAPSAASLAGFYQFGEIVSADPATARAWYQRAIELGYLEAVPDLAMLLEGQPTRDAVELLDLARRGADIGVPRCSALLLRLSPNGSLTPTQSQSLCMQGLVRGDMDCLIELANLARHNASSRPLADTLAELFSESLREYGDMIAIPRP
jgi:TPR repeat protein